MIGLVLCHCVISDNCLIRFNRDSRINCTTIDDRTICNRWVIAAGKALADHTIRHRGNVGILLLRLSFTSKLVSLLEERLHLPTMLSLVRRIIILYFCHFLFDNGLESVNDFQILLERLLIHIADLFFLLFYITHFLVKLFLKTLHLTQVFSSH